MVDSIINIGQPANTLVNNKSSKSPEKEQDSAVSSRGQDEVSISSEAQRLLTEHQAEKSSEDVKEALQEDTEASLSRPNPLFDISKT